MLNYLIDLIFSRTTKWPILNCNKLLKIKFVQKLLANIVNSVKNCTLKCRFILIHSFYILAFFDIFLSFLLNFFDFTNLINRTRVVCYDFKLQNLL